MNRVLIAYSADVNEPKRDGTEELLEEQRRKRRFTTRDAKLPPAANEPSESQKDSSGFMREK
jgi:hypothetical protein